ncbi:hypothetical protein LTR91_026333 [Friedmanniomyces endolithicus]|uniref:Uncharacterized protein n=1 Tax=Friedmanniomyces endolithicus TaxID=329885 RepID=A0A4U0UTP6_9PEZI|nr:hypothetical protein LTS09_010244 [Friedmanniomyces endolithicus]KAK0366805.1 hypothetical protein LTR94_001564 [Friedmanniomyces endolithicus]KAK0810290.1 hypothetical protein LTR59_002283 [Friedmanniomyces endolithicus]KAK0812039.1 hypothetical protein LTR38_003474 [Friedmanniomyces endolithicus]KAK0819526.1 hypothetical protein LTR75_002048 [Friedmanniomyces endolithicus]
MPIIRNPFRKQDENVRPGLTNGIEQKPSTTPGVQPVDIQKEKDSAEYKLSEINDSGVYLPPSPTERKSFWSTHSSRSTTSTNYRGHLNASDDQFSISRESFDSYRRSFDISARSPVLQATYDGGRPRASFDSRTFQAPPPRSSNSFTRPSQVPAQTQEEPLPDFEDVDIQDKPASQQQLPKKRGLFSRITDIGDHPERPASQDGVAKQEKPWHHFGGRRRGQSGQGAELGAIPGAIPKRETTPKPESQLKREAHNHVRQVSADQRLTPKSATKEAPKAETPRAVESQASAGAPTAEAEEPRADSGVDVDHAADDMKTVSLDDAPATPKVAEAATPTPRKDKQGLFQALQPQNAQAPVAKPGDS